MKGRILIVEDEKTALQALSLLLADEGYEILKAQTGGEGLKLTLQQDPDLVLLDIRLPDVNGLGVLQKLRAGHCDAAVIVMTAETTSSNAIRATQYGAFDYISKPINDEHLILLIQRALQYRKLEREVRNFRRIPPEAPNIPGMVGQSLAMQEVYKMIGRVANSDATVLITGESGTGKELVANAIHEFSARVHGFQIASSKLNCSATRRAPLQTHCPRELEGSNKLKVARSSSTKLWSFPLIFRPSCCVPFRNTPSSALAAVFQFQSISGSLLRQLRT
jgi:two-component system, NtrC family, response regulator AtoC